MNEWIKTYEQAPPINEEVELKVIVDGRERIYINKLIPMWNGTYRWCYCDYDNCDEVVAWRKKQDESFLNAEQQARNFRDGLTDSFGRY